MRGTRSRPVAVAAVTALVATATALAGHSTTAAAGQLDHGDDLPLASAVFRATHNSYSGNLDGSRGSITYQLDHGVRLLELDIHDNGFLLSHDYAVGHDEPGDAVDHTDNVVSNNLRGWLLMINAWSVAHPDHAPIMVMLDLKDDLTDNASVQAGNLGALNRQLTDVFGSRLLAAKDVPGALPTIGALRGRILTLLSGDTRTRAEYRRDLGSNPAVAINARGQIVAVNDSGSAGVLSYWTGTYGADGQVTWLRHGHYDTGVTPAVALNDDGWLVEVHRSHSGTSLWYHVGQLRPDGDISWSVSRRYDEGILPTVAFGPDGTSVREVHRSQSRAQNWDWDGTLDRANLAVAWDGATHGRTSDPLYDKANARSGAATVTVWTGSDGQTEASTLRYSTDRVAAGRIRHQQVAFLEFQHGDPGDILSTALFWGAPATDDAFLAIGRQNGRIVRAWQFDAAAETEPTASYPATDRPWSEPYVSMMNRAGAVR